MKRRESALKPVLFWNGIVDLVCVLVLSVLPRINAPILGYATFDSQGAFMAGGWAIATLALGVTRIWTSNRTKYHEAMLLMGLLEGLSLAVFCAINIAAGLMPVAQVALPLAVGVIFGALYLICATLRDR